jgi:hypothetical protein
MVSFIFLISSTCLMGNQDMVIDRPISTDGHTTPRALDFQRSKRSRPRS